MKKQIAWLLLAAVLMMSAAGCGSNTGGADADTETDQAEATEAIVDADYDPYAVENIYQLATELTAANPTTDYGTIDQDVKYYSETAGAYKHCNVLLPPGYDENQTYPVLYMLHGWTSSYKVHLSKTSYLTLLYGNMLRDSLTVDMIIVAVEMNTGDHKKAEGDMSDEELLAAYSKVIDDIPNDLMPFIEAHYPVRTGRENTAIMGISQGGTKALAAGFKRLDLFGYIASFAPDPGVVPTDFLTGTIWNEPLLEEFPVYSEDTAPYYLYLAVGSEDPENVEVTKFYGKELTRLGYKNQTDVADGYAHDHEFWRVAFYNFLHKIFRDQ